MTTETKIELALQDLFVALDERATNKANSTAARLESFVYRLSQLETVVSRVAKVENRLASLELRIESAESLTDKLDQDVAAELRATHDELRAMHRRIDELESVVKAAHRRIDELESAAAEEDPRTIIADMINDGEIRLHVD